MPLENVTNISGDPGYNLHKLTTDKINEYLHNFENDHMRWLDEILVVAKETFARHNEPELLPKTPSVKNKRRRLRGRRSSVQGENDNAEPPVKRRKSRSLSIQRCTLRRSMLPAVIEEERPQNGKKAKKKSGGKRKKPGEIKWASDDSPAESSAGTKSATTDCVKEDTAEEEKPEAVVVPVSSPEPSRKRPTRAASKRAQACATAQIVQMNTPPKVKRGTRTASRTATQKSRVTRATRNTKATTKPSEEENKESEKNDCNGDENVEPEIKSKWTPKVELRQMIQNNKVKELINKHELIIASSSEDELNSPKRLRLSNVNRTLIDAGSQKKQELNAVSKFFPTISKAEDKPCEVVENKETVDKSPIIVKDSDNDEVIPSAESVDVKTSTDISEVCPSEQMVCPDSSKDDAATGDSQEETTDAMSQEECSNQPESGFSMDSVPDGNSRKSTDKNDCDTQQNSMQNTTDGDSKGEKTDSKENVPDKFEDSLEDNAVNDMEEDSLMVKPAHTRGSNSMEEDSLMDKPTKSQESNSMDEDSLMVEPQASSQPKENKPVVQPKRLRSRSRAVKSSTSKSEDEDEESEAPKRRPNRAIRTKQRKGKKLSKRSSVDCRRSTRSKRSIKPRQSKVPSVDEETPVTNPDEADDESSPKKDGVVRAEVVTCHSDDTMELFEDSLEPTSQAKEQEHEEKEDVVPSEVAMETDEVPSTPPRGESQSEENTGHESEVMTEEHEATPPKKQKLESDHELEHKPHVFKTPVRHAGFGSSSDYHTSCGSNAESTPSPTSTGGTRIRHKPVPSFLNALHKRKDSGNYGNNTNGVITSFIRRNTPVKSKSIQERQQEIKQHIEKKRKKEEEVRRKREIERKEKLEEQRRKREERAKRAAEAREKRQQQRREKVQQLEEKYEQKQALTEKAKEEKKKEDMMKKKIFNKKKAEAEARRKQEEEVRLMKLMEQEEEQKRHMEILLRKKEFEEQERTRKMEEARRKHEERLAELEREREREIQLKKEQEIEKEMERIRLKEERERQKEEERKRREEEKKRLQLEKERKAREEEEERLRLQREKEAEEREREQKERERLKANILAHNTSQKKLNTTITMESETYELTPQRVHKPATEEDYGILDLRSDDSTDDEEAPRKKIPRWAKGAPLMAQLLNQVQNPPNLDDLFEAVEPPDLAAMFKKKRSRFFKRTSSAVWDSPMLKLN